MGMTEVLDTSLLETTGGRLKLTRLALGFSNQAELCKHLPTISASLWNNWETGDNEPSLGTIRPFVDKFNISLDWIYRGDGSSLRAGLWLEVMALLERGPAGPPSTSGAGQKAKMPAR